MIPMGNDYLHHIVGHICPEIKRFDGPDELARAKNQACKSVLRDWRYWGFCILFVLLAIMGPSGYTIMSNFLIQRYPSSRILPTALSLLALCPTFLVLVAFLEYGIRRPYRRALRQQLSLSGTPICEGCAYDLRYTDRCCPECGTPFERKAQPEHPEMAAKQTEEP